MPPIARFWESDMMPFAVSIARAPLAEVAVIFLKDYWNDMANELHCKQA